MQKLLELMQAVQLSSWFTLPWQCSLSVIINLWLVTILLIVYSENLHLWLTIKYSTVFKEVVFLLIIRLWLNLIMEVISVFWGSHLCSIVPMFSSVSLHWNNQVEGGWILDGQKRWIGNRTFAELLVIFARNTRTNQINGYAIDVLSPFIVKSLQLRCLTLNKW